MKTSTLRLLLLITSCALTKAPAAAQVRGDFQTSKATGLWSTSEAWNKFNGTTWIAATAGQLPAPTSNVYIQADHTISIDDENAICDNLYINGNNTSKLAFSAASGVLNIRGDIELFSADQNCFDSWAPGAKIVFSGTGPQGFTNLGASTQFVNVEINKPSSTLTAAAAVLSVSNTLSLSNGSVNIGKEGKLILNSAVIIRTNGSLEGTNSSDLIITGSVNDTVLLPLSGNISLDTLEISGTRTLMMDGDNDINLSGLFSIATGATYDNTSESRIINSGGSIQIAGTFITRDSNGFTGAGAAIPGIVPSLLPGCTIEYGRPGDQKVQSSVAYQNISFSGSGIKTPVNSFDAAATIYITGLAVLDASTNNVGGDSTNFSMDGGRLIVGTTGLQPKMGGSYNITGGIVQFAGNAQSIRSRTYQNIEITGNEVRNSSGNITLQANGTFTVKTGGVFRINSDAITGPAGVQTVTVEKNGIFKCGNQKGFHGFVSEFSSFSSLHQNIENIHLEAGSTVEYVREDDQPITNFNDLIYGNLVISGAGNKIAPAGKLTIQGDLLHSGGSVFVHNKGSVLFNNLLNSQSISSLTPDLVFHNLTDSSTGGDGLSVNSEISIEGTLALGAFAKLKLQADVTLRSNELTTASVAEIPSSATINYGAGLFIIERYFTPKRAWRFLSVPANTQQSVKQAWQEGALSTSEDPRPGFGTQITDKFLPDVTNGFDYYSNGPSVKKYNTVTEKWIGIAGTNIPLISNQGFMTFIRGNRTANNLYAPPSSTILRTKGQLYVGTQAGIPLTPGKFTAIGNPYASPLDMRKIATLNADKIFYVWDPKLGGLGFGAYQTFHLIGNDFFPVPGFGSYGDSALPYNYIQSGQAFFVHNSSGAEGSVNLSENAKASADSPLVNNPFVFRPAEPSAPQYLRTTLYRVNTDQSTDVVDGVLQFFASDPADNTAVQNAVKAVNFGENIGIKGAGNILLSLEKRAAIQTSDTVRLSVSNLGAGYYKFGFTTNLTAGVFTAFLQDRYNNKVTPVNLNDTSGYTFGVVADSGSAAPERFIIFFKETSPLPLRFTKVKAYAQNKYRMVQWKVENERDVQAYLLESSVTGQAFSGVKTIRPKHNNGRAANYEWLDENSPADNIFYRITCQQVNGAVFYSPVIKVISVLDKPQILISPNPINNNSLHLRFIDQPKGSYHIKVLTGSGKTLFAYTKEHQEGSNEETIELNSVIPAGIYQLSITPPSKKTFILKFLK